MYNVSEMQIKTSNASSFKGHFTDNTIEKFDIFVMSVAAFYTCNASTKG